MRIRDIDFGQTMIERPEVMYRFSSMHQDNQGSFATDKVDEKLEEGINRESLIVRFLELYET
jgi:hypothetical protein